MNTQSKTSRNCLTAIQKHRLYNWLENNKTSVHKHTAEMLANLAAEELGFAVTATNVDNSRRDLGIRIRIIRPSSGGETHDRVRELAKYVRHLYHEFNILIPSGLQNLSTGHKIKK